MKPVHLFFLFSLMIVAAAVVAEQDCYVNSNTYLDAEATARICGEKHFTFDSGGNVIADQSYIDFNCRPGTLYINTDPATCDGDGCSGTNYGQSHRYEMRFEPSRVYALCWNKEYGDGEEDPAWSWVWVDIWYDGFIYSQGGTPATPPSTPPNNVPGSGGIPSSVPIDLTGFEILVGIGLALVVIVSAWYFIKKE